MAVLGKVIPGMGNSYYKGFEARMSWVCRRNQVKTSETRIWWARGKQTSVDEGAETHGVGPCILR